MDNLYFQINGKIANVEIERHPVIPDFVILNKFKETGVWKAPIIDIDLTISKEEFISDLENFFSKLNGKDLANTDSFAEVLVDLIKEHILRARRLLIIDLETYLEEVMYVLNSCAYINNWPPITHSDGIAIKKNFRDGLLQLFDDYMPELDLEQ